MEALTRELVGSVYDPPRARSPWRLEDLLGGIRLNYFKLGRQALAEGLRCAGLQ